MESAIGKGSCSIELAAGRLAGLGVQGLANSVGDCFSILTHGRRTAIPRHQTLRATLDWSYRLLSPEDQAALRCLSAFNGSFALEDAAFVMGPLVSFGEANDCLTSLLDKSFVVTKPQERAFRYARHYPGVCPGQAGGQRRGQFSAPTSRRTREDCLSAGQ